MGDFGLSESLNISRKDAKTYIENYFESYPRVKGFMEEIIDQCKTNGYVEINKVGHVHLTSKGYLLLDSLMSDLFSLKLL